MTKKNLFILFGIVIFGITLFFIMPYLAVREIDKDLVQEARQNSPECNYSKKEYSPDYIFTSEELNQAEECTKAVTKYIQKIRNSEY